MGTTRTVRDPQQTSNLGIKHDNSHARDIFWCLAKLKRTVLAAVQLHFSSGYYPFWEYTVGMRRKPGFLWAARLGVHRFQTPNIMLLVVMQHLYYKIRIGPRLIISVDAQDTKHSPILIHSLIHFFSSLFTRTIVPIVSCKLIKASRSFSNSYQKPSWKLIEAPQTCSKTCQNPCFAITSIA